MPCTLSDAAAFYCRLGTERPHGHRKKHARRDSAGANQAGLAAARAAVAAACDGVSRGVLAELQAAAEPTAADARLAFWAAAIAPLNAQVGICCVRWFTTLSGLRSMSAGAVGHRDARLQMFTLLLALNLATAGGNLNRACKASACTDGNLVPLPCRLLQKCSVLLLLQFSHFLDQSADARRQGVGADTKAADAARLGTLLSTIGARFY